MGEEVRSNLSRVRFVGNYYCIVFDLISFTLLNGIGQVTNTQLITEGYLPDISSVVVTFLHICTAFHFDAGDDMRGSLRLGLLSLCAGTTRSEIAEVIFPSRTCAR